MRKRSVLMLPGPNEPYPEIVDELGNSIIPHYGDNWGEILPKTCEDMKRIFQTSSSNVIIWPTSGASANELVVANIVEDGDKIINLKNGFFGEMLENKITSNGGKAVNVESDFGKSIEPEEVRKAVKENPDAKAIFAVHCETSACTLNPIKEIGEIAEESDKLFIVDAISSLGGTELKMDQWNIDMCVGYASKCLGSLGVLCPIAFNEKVSEIVKKRRDKVKPYFLSLDTWTTTGGRIAYPFTMPTINVVALRMAICIALEEGLDNRFQRHQTAAKATREGVRAMGLQILPKEEDAADSVTAVLVPPGMDIQIRKLLEDEYNVMIAGSLGKYGRGTLLRIGHMGATASPEYVMPTLYALERVLEKLGQKVPDSEAMKVAAEIFKNRPHEWIKGLLTRFNRRHLPEFWGQ